MAKATDTESEEASHNPAALSPRRHTEKSRRKRPAQLVLVVESDARLQRAYREALASEGYRAEAVRANREALRRLAAGPAPDCVLLGTRYNEQEGSDLLPCVLAQHPETPVVLGGAQDRPWADFASWGADSRLATPTDLRAMARTVSRTLAAKGRQKTY